MVSKKELKLVEIFQFYDRYGILPQRKKRVDIMLSGRVIEKIEKLSEKKGISKSQIVEQAVLEI